MGDRSLWIPDDEESSSQNGDDSARPFDHAAEDGSAEDPAQEPQPAAARESGESDPAEDWSEQEQERSAPEAEERSRPEAEEQSEPEANLTSTEDWRAEPDPAEPPAPSQQAEQGRSEERREPVAAARSRPQPEDDRGGDDHDGDRGPDDGDSDVDLMGRERRRKVVGQRYGASRARQLLYYGLFVGFLVAAYIGFQVAVSSLDKAPAKDPDKAPWSKPGAPQGPVGGFQPEGQGSNGPARFQ